MNNGNLTNQYINDNNLPNKGYILTGYHGFNSEGNYVMSHEVIMTEQLHLLKGLNVGNCIITVIELYSRSDIIYIFIYCVEN
jgi:hypothetical protein